MFLFLFDLYLTRKISLRLKSLSQESPGQEWTAVTSHLQIKTTNTATNTEFKTLKTITNQ